MGFRLLLWHLMCSYLERRHSMRVETHVSAWTMISDELNAEDKGPSGSPLTLAGFSSGGRPASGRGQAL